MISERVQKLEKSIVAHGYLSFADFSADPEMVEEFKKDNGRILETTEESYQNYALNAGGTMLLVGDI